MLAKPTVNVAWNDETFVDALGQRWAPGSVTLEWNAPSGLPNPSVTVKVIALARPEMTHDQLEDAHIQAARDVLSAAMLALEEPVYHGMVLPPAKSVTEDQIK
jgi:hypothetical protein